MYLPESHRTLTLVLYLGWLDFNDRYSCSHLLYSGEFITVH